MKNLRFRGIGGNSFAKHSLSYEFHSLFIGALCVHLVLFFFGLALHSAHYALYQVFSMLVYGALLKFWKQHHFVSSCVIYFLEVTANALITANYLGSSLSSELYLIVLIPVANCIVFTEYSKRIKHFYMGLNIFCCIASYFFIDYLSLFLFAGRELTAASYPRGYLVACFFLETFHISTAFILLFITTLFFIGRMQKGFGAVQSENEQLDTIASRDELTGLYNRRKMEQLLKEYDLQWRQQQKPFVIVMGDVDGFKQFNDTYGHAAGDTVLRGLAELLSAFLRQEDAVCRWGGEEFLFVLQCSESVAFSVVERLRISISQTPIAFSDQHLPVTMTFGLSEIRPGQTLARLIDRADHCLYEGKQLGRNRVIGDTAHP